MKKHSGLIAAPFAPLHSDGTLNLAIVPAYYNFLVRNGVEGVFINGTTGEGPSLTQKEKKAIIAAWTECSRDNKKLEVINLVGGTSYMECIENAIYSAEAGVEAIAVIGPYFFRPSEPGQLTDFVTKIGNAVPEMPVYYYHIPSITGVTLSMSAFLKQIAAVLPNFAGIKYTHEDLNDYKLCLDFDGGKYDILWGRDEVMLSALSAGGKGFVGSTYNYASPLYLSIIKAFSGGDLQLAKKYQQKSVEIVSLLEKYGGIAVGKAFMRYAGIECGEYRSPLRNITDVEYNLFSEEIKALGLDKYFSK